MMAWDISDASPTNQVLPEPSSQQIPVKAFLPVNSKPAALSAYRIESTKKNEFPSCRKPKGEQKVCGAEQERFATQ